MAEPVEQFADADLVPHGFLDTNLPRYKSIDQLPELHTAASKLLSQLDNYSQDITWQLESVLSELSHVRNRLNYELELLRGDVIGLAKDVAMARPTVENTVQLPADSKPIAQLERLDRAKQQMEAVQRVFVEAKQFDEQKITSDVMSLIDSGNLDAALAKVERAAELCQVWKGTNGYGGKLKFVTGLRKKVETIISTEPSSPTGSRPSSQAGSQAGARPDSPATSRPSSSQQGSPEGAVGSDSYYSIIGQFQRKIF
jgi:hypothetical protein